MTTVTSDQERTERLEQLDAMAAREWAAYGARLRDLEGAEYDATEIEAWDDLQSALEHLRGERLMLVNLDEDGPQPPS
jgi:hypothetical protein